MSALIPAQAAARRNVRGAALALCLALAGAVQAGAPGAPQQAPVAGAKDQARLPRLLDALRRAHPATRFDAVLPTPLPGLYQVRMGDNVAFVAAANLRYMVFGRLFDLATMRDLSGAPQPAKAAPGAPASAAPQAAAVSLRDLPLADAVTEKRGDGSRSLVVFTDPACPYCRQLDTQLVQLDNVTIHYYLVPFQGAAAPLAIWCAADRLAALRRVMHAGPGAEPAPECANPLERNRLLAETLGVRGTPTLLFGDQRLESYVTAADLERHLDSTYRSQHE